LRRVTAEDDNARSLRPGFAMRSFACVTAALLAGAVLAGPSGLAARTPQVTPPAVPPVQVAPLQDPLVLAMEEELRKLRHLEGITEDLETREALLTRIIAVCINLGRDCGSFEQKRDSLRAQLAKQGEKDRQFKQRAIDNETFKKRARQALLADDLSSASTNVKLALGVNASDPETLELRMRLNAAQTNRLYRRIAVVVMATIVVLAILIPVLRSRTAGVKPRELEMLEGPAPGDVFPLEKEKTSLGAVASEADIVIADAFRKISRRHCEISRNGKHYFLVDCSTNGTFVNDKLVPKGEPVLLKKGDRIALADEVVLRFR
jgi:FHA domain